MDAMEAILTRRSVRQYTSEPVSEQTIQALLQAAMSAPSAGNQQPWQFIVIDARQMLDAIPGVHPFARMLQQAPLAILVCGDLTRERGPGFWVQDCSAATQNLLLAARAQGLGAVWLGVYPREERIAGLRELLGLPEHVVPLALVSIGHPASEQRVVDRYDEGRVHRNRW
jgi:nitroreductase